MPIFAPAFGSFGDIVMLTKAVYKIATTLAHIIGQGAPSGFVDLIKELDNLGREIERAAAIVETQKVMTESGLSPEHLKQLEDQLVDTQKAVKTIEEEIKKVHTKFETPTANLGLVGKGGSAMYKFGYSVFRHDQVSKWNKEVTKHYEDLQGILNILTRSMNDRLGPEAGQPDPAEQEQEIFKSDRGMVLFEDPQGRKIPLDWAVCGSPDKRRDVLRLWYRRSPKYRQKVERNEYKLVYPDNTNPNLDDEKDECKVEVGAHVKLVWLPHRKIKPKPFTYKVVYVPGYDHVPPEYQQLPPSPPISEPDSEPLPSEDEPEPDPKPPTVIQIREFRIEDAFARLEGASASIREASPAEVPLPDSPQASVVPLEPERQELPFAGPSSLSHTETRNLPLVEEDGGIEMVALGGHRASS